MKPNRLPFLSGRMAFALIFLGAGWIQVVQAAHPNVNPLITEWTGAFGGVPAFDQMDLKHLKPALEEGMQRLWEEVQAIANQPEPATFENTLVALQNAGRDLNRVNVYYRIWKSNLSSPAYREIAKEMDPRLSELETRILQDEALFARVQAVYSSPESSHLRPDQKRLLQQEYDHFVRHGALLKEKDQRRHRVIQNRLTTLESAFANNVLADEEGDITFLDAKQLGGLPDSFLKAAASAAEKRGRPGHWAVTNTRSSIDPFLTFSRERELRKQVWQRYYNRGNNGGENDNNAIISEMLRLRQERSKLLGI